jgi:Tol biopolymer transport system component
MQSNILKTLLLIVILGVGGILFDANSAQGVSEAERQLQKAILLEDIDGDLQAAIEQYKKIVAENGRDRAVTARALLRLAGCYEKLGRDDARKTYERLVRDYADQREVVMEARTRLALLARVSSEATSTPKFRRLVIPSLPATGSGMLSPDGTKIAFVAEGSVWMVPIQGDVHPDVAGQPVRLTPDVGAWDNGNVSVAWSGDGKWIAFRGKSNALYIVPSSGGEPKQIPDSGNCRGSYCLSSLSPDGKMVTFTQLTGKAANPLAMLALPVTGGSAQHLAIGIHPAFSPDGKRIAHIGFPAGSVQVMPFPVDDGTPIVINSSEGRSPVWSPEGRMIAFLVRMEEPDEAGILPAQVWVVPISEKGTPLADPTKFGLEEINTIDFSGKTRFKLMYNLGGWSAQNEIALLFQTPIDQALYTVPVSGGRPTRVAMLGREPRWSPDGQSIFFRGQTNIEWVPAKGGKDMPVPIRGKLPMIVSFPVGSNDVSSDGKKIAFAGSFRGGAGGGPSIFTVAVEGGEPKQLTFSSLGDANPTWSPDGKWIAFTKTTKIGEQKYGNRICLIPSEGGEAKEISSDADQVAYAELDWSPDGANIAYFGTDNTIRLISPKGGPSRILTRIPLVNYHLGLSWSPDSSRLVYTTANGKAWIIPVSGGEPQALRTGFDGRVTQVAWSPDGQEFAFTGEAGGGEEIWLMSDFVNLVKTARQ